jgi:hypothetical protein
MLMSIICFAFAVILLIFLIILNVQVNRQEKNKKSGIKQISDQTQPDEASIKEMSVSIESAVEQIDQPETKIPLVDELQEGESEKESLKIKDSSYREALKSFQAKKPELVKEKSQIADSDYRNALRSMQNKDK